MLVSSVYTVGLYYQGMNRIGVQSSFEQAEYLSFAICLTYDNLQFAAMIIPKTFLHQCKRS